MPDRAPSKPEPQASVHRSVPFVHVVDVQKSFEFYKLLGFEQVHAIRDPLGRLTWTLLKSERAELMLALASGPIDAHQQAILLYMYSDDVKTLRSRLLSRGVRDAGKYQGMQTPHDHQISVHEVSHPPYMPQGELRVIDPDGYVILIGQLQRHEI